MNRNNEKELLNNIKLKNEGALRSLIRIYSPSIYKYVFRQIKDKYESEEIVQDVFMDFIEGIRAFRGDSSIKTYLISIARYKTVDFIRKKKRKTFAFSAFPPNMIERFHKIFLDDEFDKSELQEKIQNTLSQLPNDYQVVLRLKYVEGRKMKEIADLLSIKFKAAESLLMRARRAFVAVYTIA